MGIDRSLGRPTPARSLSVLLEGNRRFVSGEFLHPNQDADTRNALAESQAPFAVIFGCSDSRLAAEIVFDRGLGDLFVVRTAGHVAGPEVLGTIEYAVAVLDVPLIAVVGHDSCGAVTAATEAVKGGATYSGYLADVVEAVTPSVLTAREAGLSSINDIGVEHTRRMVTQLTRRSALLARAVESGRTGVVGLSYRLAEGTVRVVADGGLELQPGD